MEKSIKGEKDMEKESKFRKLEWLKEYMPTEQYKKLEKEVEEWSNKLQEESYMEGYDYAIQLLKESRKK